MSHYQGKDIQEVAEQVIIIIIFLNCKKINIFEIYHNFIFQGPGLVFEVYPEAIATLPGSQVWSCLFFVTMIMLGMDSAVSIIQYYIFIFFMN